MVHFTINFDLFSTYRGANKGLNVLLSRTQAGPGRTFKQEQEDISRNHIPRLYFPLCILPSFLPEVSVS